MGVENKHFQTSVTAGDDMNGAGYLYHAIAVNDGKVANTPEEATGILVSKPKTGEQGTVLYAGELKFAAGAAISKGDKLTVASSGWFTSAGSLEAVVGEARYDVTSGSHGTGFFSFPQVRDMGIGFTFGVTAADAIVAGCAYALSDNKLANNGLEAAGVAESTIASGSAGSITVQGIVQGIVDDAVAADADLMVVTSGFFSAVTSGYVPNGRALSAITSGSTGSINFWGGGGMLLA